MTTGEIVVLVVVLTVYTGGIYMLAWYNGFDRGAQSEYRRYVHVDQRGRGYYKPPRSQENK